MPYASVSELPEPVREALPVEAQKIFLSVFNEAYAADCGDVCATKQAWAAVKRTYKKTGEKWEKIENSAREPRRHGVTLQRLGVHHSNGGKKVFYTPESFKNANAWAGVPVIYADVSKMGNVLRHPDFDLVDSKALPDGYGFVGTVMNPAVPDEGEPRLISELAIDDPTLERRIENGEISISTAFGGFYVPMADGTVKLQGQVKPNHVLLFDRGICPNCYSNDYGAVFLNCIAEDKEMDEESKGFLKMIADALTKRAPEPAPITNAQAGPDPQVEILKAENAKLAQEIETVRAATEAAKKENEWAQMKNALPAGWLGEKEAETRKEYEASPGAFALKLIAHNAKYPGDMPKAEGNDAGVMPQTIEAANAQAQKEIEEFEAKYGLKFVE